MEPTQFVQRQKKSLLMMKKHSQSKMFSVRMYTSLQSLIGLLLIVISVVSSHRKLLTWQTLPHASVKILLLITREYFLIFVLVMHLSCIVLWYAAALSRTMPSRVRWLIYPLILKSWVALTFQLRKKGLHCMSFSSLFTTAFTFFFFFFFADAHLSAILLPP